MKKVTSLLALCALATAASGQSYIAGLNFNTIPDVSANVGFDSGSQSGLFTLNIQSNAEDNNNFFGYTESAWAAGGEFYSDGVNADIAAGSITPIPATVQSVTGQTASTNLFGGTSANAQDFSATNGISFGVNTDGFFTIGVAQAINNFSISFDVFADAGQGQTAGSLTVGGQNVNVTTASANTGAISLGNISAGLITFDLSGVDNGASFDNFMISGTVVPEPSSFAAIAGVLAIGFVGLRRRR